MQAWDIQILRCSDIIYKQNKTNKQISTSDSLSLAKNQDCETREMPQKFCETHGFWRTIHRPLYFNHEIHNTR